MPIISDLLKHNYDYVFLFGKHKHESISEVLEEDPGYILWAADNVDSFNPTEEILDDAHLALENHKNRIEDSMDYCYSKIN